MSKTSGLGRGLGAILEEVEEAYKQNSGSSEFVKEIKLEEIIVNPFQPRKQFDPESIAELSESIKRHGLLQPVVVIRSNDKFMLIAGERRLRATRLAGIESIKAIVADIDKDRIRELALIENIQRENLNSIELAISLKELIEEHDLTHEELSDIVKKSRSFITNTLRLLQLEDYVKDKLMENKITHGHAKVLVGLDKEEQKKITDSIIGQKLSVRETEELVSKLKEPLKEKKSKKVSEARKLELGKLIATLNNAYGIKTKKTSSSITIQFENQEQIEELLKSLKNS
ncbi:MAG: ParB/RepB/Spo0J family partition protein [Campylobacteraceae bacterium]|jgi:ParB family chromosome partitioning protein|nr:ParB/RepB/Spo0J family partition protein [Campylobacteraceae bacterium]